MVSALQAEQQTIWDEILGRGKIFSSSPEHPDRFSDHLASYPMATAGSSTGDKAKGA
jgi:hypothetical protein